ncbi:outer membrane beta-barrel protein [Hirschia litorea]|uniref:Outer membrane beta-barrel protein n=1 Tax=Hirschia litorea TaxID=1199156 RepID=A0ABW2IFY7_9PROT
MLVSKLIKAISVGALTTVIGTQVAVAQDNMFSRDRIVGAGEHYLPEFEPRVVRVGTFKFQPELGLGVETNSNIYALENDEQSDVIVAVSPAFNLDSDWSRHALGVTAEAKHKEYTDNGDESHTNIGGFLRGRLDVTREFNFTVTGSAQSLTEQRGIYGGSVDLDTSPAEPAEYDVASFGGAANFERDAVQLSLGANVRQLSFDDVRLNNDFVDDRSFRDFDETEIKARAGYAINPDIAVFVQALTYERDYSQDINLADTNPNNDIRRDAEGYRATVGTNFQLSSLIRGEVAVGYLFEEREDARFEDIEGLAVNADVQWLPTPLTTLSLGVDRYSSDTGQIDIPSALVTSGEVRVDHELKRNILLTASANAGVEEFDGNNAIASYNQDFYDVGAGAVYKLNPNAHLDFNLRYYNRDSSNETRGRNFDQTIVGVGLKLFP